MTGPTGGGATGTTPRAPSRPEGPGPLAGIRVTDFSRLFAGPLCTMILADLGADVIKVEPPSGDEARGFGPPFLGGEGMNFMALNRGKRSIVLDLKRDEDRRVAHRLIETSDVLVENFRPGVTERLGIDPSTARRLNPRLVYCSITGFGTSGPYRDRPALDLILQGMGGVMHRQGRGGRPELVVITIADCYAAALAVQAILAALYARTRDGRGQVVEVDLFRSLVFSQAYRILTGAGEVRLAAWEDVCPYGPFRGGDGRWFNVAVVTERTWSAFCEAIGAPELARDPRFATNRDRVRHKDELLPILERTFSGRPADEWLAALDAAGVPCGPILRVEDLFTDPHVVATEMIVELPHAAAGPVWTIGTPFHMHGTPLAVGRPAPLLGEHGSEILAELSASPRAPGGGGAA